MAGAYADYPDNRIAYHLDGTVGFANRVGDAPTPLSAGQLWTMNNELTDLVATEDIADWPGGNTIQMMWGLVFPAPLDLDAVFERIFLNGVGSTNLGPDVQTSTNTTNGQDGTWTVLRGFSAGTSVVPDYRSTTPVVSVAAGITGIRWRWGVATAMQNFDVRAVHLFGRYSAASNRLELWDPSVDQRIDPAGLDWGNTPRSTTDTRTFRVKNRSATLTANSIVISAGDSSTAGEIASSLDFNIGSGYAATQNIGNLAPGAISGVVTIRRTLSSVHPLGAAAGLVIATPGSWT
jgi:hypothetical protein